MPAKPDEVTDFSSSLKARHEKQQIISIAVIEGQGDNDDAEISLPLDDFSDSIPNSVSVKLTNKEKIGEGFAPEKLNKDEIEENKKSENQI